MLLRVDDPNLPYESDDLDFIELLNVGAEPVDLSEVAFSDGITFPFGSGAVTTLEPEQRVVVVRNPEAFTSRYGAESVSIAGVFSGRLSNSGERIVLTGGLGQTLTEVRFEDGWFPITDGEGFSLVRRDEQSPLSELHSPDDWRPSHYIGGSPGAPDPGFNPDAIIISEAMTHTDAPETDWLELHNTTSTDIDLGGWYLSSIRSNPREYAIPPETVLPAGGYLVFTNADPNFVVGYGSSMGFTISKLGERITLTSPGLEPDELGGYRLDVDFTYGFNSTSFIRHVNSAGQVQYLPSVENTPGWPNAAPSVDRIWDHGRLSQEAVISEIMYYPAGHADEYIELYNPHPVTVELDQPFPPSWRFTEGVHYNFPDRASMAPRSYALVVPIDPVEFRAKYDVPPETQVFGPYLGELVNTGEQLSLSRAVEAAAFVPYSVTDQVYYNHASATWPAEAAGGGASLVRVSYRAFGNDADNWQAGPVGGSPGRPNWQSVTEPRVVDRFVFYNHSSFDGNDAAATVEDDSAIAIDKVPLLPGQAASFANYTSYYRGLNGIMVDIHALPGEPGLTDFEFRVGNDADPDQWSTAPPPLSITTRRGDGVGGSDRVTLIWGDGVLTNQWLQVSVLSTQNTGLLQPDVFYFGNSPGDTGNSASDAEVDGTDFGRVRDFYNNRNALAITNAFDFDRDQSVDSADLAVIYQQSILCASRLEWIDTSNSDDPSPERPAAAHRMTRGLELAIPDVVLIPNQPGQSLPIRAGGATPVTGVNLRVEIGTDLTSSNTPRLQRAALHGGIWDSSDTTDWQCKPAAEASALHASLVLDQTMQSVVPDGLVTELIVDTTGVTFGSFPLHLSHNGIASDFLGTPAYLLPGSISIARPGDANLDGRFDSLDFVQAFQQGQYEDDVVGNSTWTAGDWNQDGEFDSHDFVFAFQQGTYETAAPLESVAGVIHGEIAAAFIARRGLSDRLLTPLGRDSRRQEASSRSARPQPSPDVVAAVRSLFAQVQHESGGWRALDRFADAANRLVQDLQQDGGLTAQTTSGRLHVRRGDLL